MPGMENFAPGADATPAAGRPGRRAGGPSCFSSRRRCSRDLGRAAPPAPRRAAGSARQASVVMVKPGGTGRPSRVISARLAPLPPRRSFWSMLPWVKSYTYRGHAGRSAPRSSQLVRCRPPSTRRAADRQLRRGYPHVPQGPLRKVGPSSPPRLAGQPPLTDSSAPLQDPRPGQAGQSSQPSGSVGLRAPVVRPRGPLPTSGSNGLVGVDARQQLIELGERARPGPAAARTSPATAKPLRYQATCLRMSRQPVRPRRVGAQQLGVPAEGRQRPSGQVGVGRYGLAREAAASWPNSQGRPRQPRPTTTPSQPVCAHHRQRVGGGPDVAVAEHRDRARRAAPSSRAIADQSAAPE